MNLILLDQVYSLKCCATAWGCILTCFCTGGPKLRKWYGAPDLLPKDGGAEGDEKDESSGAYTKTLHKCKMPFICYSYLLAHSGMWIDIEEPRDAVLVTNGDSEIGQVCFVLQLPVFYFFGNRCCIQCSSLYHNFLLHSCALSGTIYLFLLTLWHVYPKPHCQARSLVRFSLQRGWSGRLLEDNNM